MLRQCTDRSTTEKVSFHKELLLQMFWLINFYRRQPQMRVVFEDEAVRKVKARCHHQAEDKPFLS